jgi:N-acetylglucosaminyldiphosphoundecaprenol N-acetyl-beta-D-mannosaminyltransferase
MDIFGANCPNIHLLGVPFALCTRLQLLEAVETCITSNQKRLVLSGNVFSLNLAYRHDWLRNMFNSADLVRVDGAGLMLAARLKGHKIPERVTWADFAWELASFAEQRGFTVFFLGGAPGVAEKAAERLQRKYPSLRVLECHHGFFEKTLGSSDTENVVKRINAARPNILIVGFGMPAQERWLLENWARIEASITFTGGGVFDYVSGRVRRPPRWMTNNGLEWMGRFIIEPRRLWRRYLIGNPLFLWRVVKERVGWNGGKR